MSKFSSGDVSTLTGPVDVKHGGGVTYHDSSIELGTGDDGNILNVPSWDPAAELLRLCRVRITGLFLISTNGISSSESVWGALLPSPSRSTSSQSSSSSSTQLVVIKLNLTACCCCGWGWSSGWSSAMLWITWFSLISSVSVGLLTVELPSKYDASVLNIIRWRRTVVFAIWLVWFFFLSVVVRLISVWLHGVGGCFFFFRFFGIHNNTHTQVLWLRVQAKFYFLLFLYSNLMRSINIISWVFIIIFKRCSVLVLYSSVLLRCYNEIISALKFYAIKLFDRYWIFNDDFSCRSILSVE